MMMTQLTPKTWTRWYERDRNVLTLVTKLRRMDTWLLEAYSKAIIHYANQLSLAHADDPFRLQHGSDKHLGLLKSMGRKRWYDKNKYAYRAFNALYLLPQSVRIELAQQFQEAHTLIKLYTDRCRLQGVNPTQAVAESLLSTYVNAGEPEAFALLDELELNERLDLKETQAAFNLS